MKDKFPGLKKCLAMMADRDPQTREDGFGYLLPRAPEFVPELMAAFRTERDPGLRAWLLELISTTGSPAAFDLLAEQLGSANESLRNWAAEGLKQLNTKEARTLLWQSGFRTPRHPHSSG